MTKKSTTNEPLFLFLTQYGLIAFFLKKKINLLAGLSRLASEITTETIQGKKKWHSSKRESELTQFLDSKGLQRRVIFVSFSHLTATILLLQYVILKFPQLTNEDPEFNSLRFAVVCVCVCVSERELFLCLCDKFECN